MNGYCWGANATIRAYMQQHFHNTSDFGALQAVFEAKILAGNAQDGKHSILWQENFGDRSTAGYTKGTVVEVWKGGWGEWLYFSGVRACARCSWW